MPKSYVLLYNIAKSKNYGNLIRSANAFGVSEILIVGRKRFNSFGAHGTQLHTAFRHFLSLEEAVAWLRERQIRLLGVEIAAEASPIEARPFSGDTAFFLGNEGTGLSERQMALCDGFVYIRQHGEGASLNVNVAAAIALHHFALWAGFQERPIFGNKFQGALTGHPAEDDEEDSCPRD